MKIEVLYFPDCPNYVPALALVHEVLAETGIQAQVELVRVETEADAQRLQFIGSPTVRVNGLDVDFRAASVAKDFGLRCRLYGDDGRVLGWPSRRMLRDSIEMCQLAEMDMLGTCC